MGDDTLTHLLDPLRDARVAAAPLMAIGYEELGERSEGTRHFGNAYLELQRGDVRVRLIRDRLEWIVGFSSIADSDRWYGQHVVLRVMGHDAWDTGTEDFSSFVELCRWLAEHAPLWERYFHASEYSVSKALFARLGAEFMEQLGS